MMTEEVITEEIEISEEMIITEIMGGEGMTEMIKDMEVLIM